MTRQAAEIAEATSDADWAAVRAVRQAVFVEEQACPPDEEWDVHDAPERCGYATHHLLARVDGRPAGCARWRAIEDAAVTRAVGEADREVRAATRKDGAAKLERFAVLVPFRGTGLGRALVARAIDDATAAGHRSLVLYAQVHLVAFYTSFGFQPFGERFWDVGIEHVKMKRTSEAA